MECLDTKYSFSKKVLNREPLIYAIIPHSNKEFNSQCVITDSKTIPIIFRYYMKENYNNVANPIAVFFHELGHMLYAHCFENPLYVPDTILNFLQKLC